MQYDCRYCDLWNENAGKCTHRKCVKKIAPEYEPSADDLKNLWRMTDPTELKRRGVPSVAEYLQIAIQDDKKTE